MDGLKLRIDKMPRMVGMVWMVVMYTNPWLRGVRLCRVGLGGVVLMLDTMARMVEVSGVIARLA